MFASTCSADPEPGMGRIRGDLASNQASTTWRGLTPCRAAASPTAAIALGVLDRRPRQECELFLLAQVHYRL